MEITSGNDVTDQDDVASDSTDVESDSEYNEVDDVELITEAFDFEIVDL